jgi:hypothetical protein
VSLAEGSRHGGFRELAGPPVGDDVRRQCLHEDEVASNTVLPRIQASPGDRRAVAAGPGLR